MSFNNVGKVDKVVLACCALHNFFRRNSTNYLSSHSTEHKNISDHNLEEGDWRAELHRLYSLQNRRTYYNSTAKNIRQAFTDYYNNAGKVPFQESMIK
ncbi:hypothetical protein QE152_g6149 [Popillia japonica]|uniref:DDE Tnp4 domain-containing protein n=1 Tax=Popillia japonica TaxID=7064 RepID=A0AAW1MJ86_POPJA